MNRITFIPEYSMKFRDPTPEEIKEFKRARRKSNLRDFIDFLKGYIFLWFGAFFTIISLLLAVGLVLK